MIVRDVREAARLLEKAESGVAAFYHRCAQAFPGDAELWDCLRREELQHAEYIRRAQEVIERHPERFPAEREFNAPAVREFIEGVREAGGRVEAGEVGRREALLIAYQIEESYVEKRFADAVFTGDETVRPLYDRIVNETLAHRQLLKDALDAALHGLPVPGLPHK